MAEQASERPYILGLDIGSRSIGWARIELAEGQPVGILDAGARCFEAGVEGDIESGRDSSRATKRRQARAARRTLRRRARRMAKLFRLLQRHGLLPEGPTKTPEERDAILTALDTSLRAKHLDGAGRAAHQVLPYQLRATALDTRLEPFELGRALYHLAQRRGFLSNRKRPADDKEAGEVQAGINRTYDLMQRTGSRTLGEAMSKVDTDDERIRKRWTERAMYQQEFDLIWTAQAMHHPGVMTEDFRWELRRAIFHQRPLKPQSHLVGRCELEPGERRAPMALPAAQRFRMLQKVNDLKIIEPTGEIRALSVDERTKLLDALGTRGDMTFDRVRKLLDLRKARKTRDKATGQESIEPGHEFNLAAGDEPRIIGDRTSAKLLPILGDLWTAMPEDRKDALVRAIIDFEHPWALVGHLRRLHGLDDATAKPLSEIALEDTHASYSRPALKRLAARMEDGTPFATARDAEYPRKAREALDLLPPVKKAVADLRNPAVCRAMTEVRKLVNGLIRMHGKPVAIRVELARDLKNPRKAREAIFKRNRGRQTEREAAREAIIRSEAGVRNPTAADLEKWLLAEECRWTCPYTGLPITPATLLGPRSQFDVEHIIPFSVSLDNSFANKTLCQHEENRNHKQNRTPHEAYAGDEQRYHQMLQVVRRFTGPAADAKLRRFLMTEQDVREFYGEDFTARHLSDTRYSSRLAGDYLSLLYEDRRPVQVSSGSVTAFLRDEWDLNGILPSLPDSLAAGSTSGAERAEKTRADHRHHAVDAVAIALTTAATVKRLSDAAAGAQAAGRRRFSQLSAPWNGFAEDVRSAVGKIVVSHRPDRRLAGALHAETNYSPPVPKCPRGSDCQHVRVPLARLTKKQVEEIVDERVKELVKSKLNGGDPTKVFATQDNCPMLPAGDGRRIPIHSVRIHARATARAVGGGARQRHLASGSDTLHHTVIMARQTRRGEVWEDHPVDRLDVHRAIRDGKPVIRRDWGTDAAFRFSLCKGDCVEMEDAKGVRRVYVVRSISKSDITLRLHQDARTDEEIKAAGQRSEFRIRSADALRIRGARKVEVTILGEVIGANG